MATRSNRGGFPQYGELWMMDLDPVMGAEISGVRPVLVVSNNAINQYSQTVTVLPLTSQPARRDYPDEVFLPAGTGNLRLASRVKANMVRVADKSRLRSWIGRLPEEYYPQVHQALRVHLNIPR